ncbi:uncharacterized protein LOC143153465 isoform X2 [Ptiloglossa arizonensis]|uniref:uncharacterized protein LOC143153465 isoform X2 n=1 Tax=Ptiloglossa arizonensis TaxID=3350558 RepID=UPI003F9F2C79
MVDSDADSRYNWKRDDFNESHRERRVTAMNDVRLTGSNHLNRLTFNDSQKRDSQSSGLILNTAVPTSSRSGTEIRFINPAIYAETLNNEDDEREIQIRVKVSSKDSRPIEGNYGDSTGKSDIVSTLSLKNNLPTSFVDHAGDQVSAQETYRCYSLNSPTTSLESDLQRSKSVTSCRPSNRVEKRCRISGRTNDGNEVFSVNQVDSEVQRCILNGYRVVQVSTTSLSSISISENKSTESNRLKKISYNEWMRKKQQAAQQKKEEEDQALKKKQTEAERLAREKEERESQERDNFLKWTEKKKKEREQKKLVIEKELELQKLLKEIEDKAAGAKSLYLRQWAHKKREEEKGRQKKEEMKRKELDEEKKKSSSKGKASVYKPYALANNC